MTLGLLPGAGGLTRTVRMLGTRAALPLLTDGTQLRPGQARTAGMMGSGIAAVSALAGIDVVLKDVTPAAI